MLKISAKHIAELFQRQGLKTLPRSEHPAAWAEALARSDYVPVLYTNEMIAYNLAYHAQLEHDHPDTSVLDISVLIQDQNQIIAVWPLSLHQSAAGVCSVTSHGSAILPPLLTENLPQKACTRLLGRCHDFLITLCEEYGISEFSSSSIHRELGQPNIDTWQNICAERGACLSVEHCLYGDLSLSLAEYKSQIRKSYKSLITAGQKLWTIKISNPDALDAPWAAFQKLHAKAAGRVTRSQQTWDIQKQLIQAEAAFLVYSEDSQGQMIGGAYFNISRDEAIYSVGAYDRDLFDQPIAHTLQFTAISEMMERGLRRYRIGAYVYPWQAPKPTPKQINISKFKSGFATGKILEVSIFHPMPASTILNQTRP